MNNKKATLIWNNLTKEERAEYMRLQIGLPRFMATLNNQGNKKYDRAMSQSRHSWSPLC